MTDKDRYERAVNKLPMCISGYRKREHSTLYSLVELVHVEIFHYEGGQLSDIRDEADLLECKRYMNQYEHIAGYSAEIPNVTERAEIVNSTLAECEILEKSEVKRH